LKVLAGEDLEARGQCRVTLEGKSSVQNPKEKKARDDEGRAHDKEKTGDLGQTGGLGLRSDGG